MLNYPKEGQMVVDIKGNFAMAYPDGTLKPIGKPAQSKTSAEPQKENKSTTLSWESLE
jgi:hypothetical protein